MSTTIQPAISDDSLEQEIRARIKGQIHLLQVDSSLSHFRLDPNLRAFQKEGRSSVIFEIPCTDGQAEIPVQATFVKDSENGAIYKLIGLSELQRQMLYNHFDNCVEGIVVSREQLLSDTAPPLEVRDVQLVEKNRELTTPAAHPRKQWVLSGIFLIIIAFFGWLLFISLFNIVAEDWGQQDYYNHVAAARLHLAEDQLKEIDANLNFTRAVLGKMEDPEFKKDISPFQEEIFRRDLTSLEAHEDQMKEVVAFLKLNQTEVTKGNFFYERRVLDAFSSQDHESANTSSSAQLLMK